MKTSETYTICITYCSNKSSPNNKITHPTRPNNYNLQGQGKFVLDKKVKRGRPSIF